jgi:hypothetical protein
MTKQQLNNLTGNKRYTVTGFYFAAETNSLVEAVDKARTFARKRERWGIIKKRLPNGHKEQIFICTYDSKTQRTDESWSLGRLTRAEQQRAQL